VTTYRIKQYALEQGALEIQYIEEFFGEFPGRKAATEIVRRLEGRDHLILMAESPLPDDPTMIVPVAYRVSHELRAHESDPPLADLVSRLAGNVQFEGRRVLYNWIGGTRSDWRGQGFFRALTEEQEAWAMHHGFDEIVVKTKNRFYDMRGTLDRLRFDVIKYEPQADDNAESKVYLSKRLGIDVLRDHRSSRSVVRMG
jgi:GNAT superfamily N-acetyltransferase